MGLEDVLRNTEAWKDQVLAAVFALGQHEGQEAEAEMKRDAPWTDRTSHARQGLKGRAEQYHDRVQVTLSHTMEYGVHLELANSGQYAILKPTAQRRAPRFIEDVKRVVGA